MSFIRKTLIFVTIFFASTCGVFANENTNETDTQKTINKYILEVYKFQWSKIIADLDANLNKVATTKKSKIDAYSNIQDTLLLKKSATEKDIKIGRNTKMILIKYLDYMIDEIETKKNELK